MGGSATGTRLGTLQEANHRAASAALVGLVCIRWDLVPGVRWSSPGTGNDGEMEATKGKKGTTSNKRGRGGQTWDKSRRQIKGKKKNLHQK